MTFNATVDLSRSGAICYITVMLNGVATLSPKSPIMVAYGDPLGRTCICEMLCEAGSDGIIQAAHFEELLQCLAAEPSIVIIVVDLDLPGMGAEVGLKCLRSMNRGLKIAALSNDTTHAPLNRLIDIGDGALISKQQARPRLVSELARLLSEPARNGLSSAKDVVATEGATQKDFFGHALTDRHQDVLRAMITGKTNREISTLLNISEGTVKVHLNAAFKILGVHNRVGAAAAFMKLKGREDRTDGPLLL